MNAQNPIEKAKPVKSPRVSKQLREAVALIAQKGRTVQQAAEDVGLTERAIHKAYEKPHIKALHNQLFTELRRNEAQRSVARMVAIADDESNPGSTRADASKWLAGIEGISPIAKAQVHSHHTFDYDYPGPDIDGNDT